MTAPLGELSDVGSAEAVDILLAGDDRSDSILGNALWKGELDQNAVDGGVMVEVLDAGDELGLRGRLVELDELTVDAALLVPCQ